MQDDEKKGDPVKYVEALLSLRDKYQAIIEEAFEGDKSFLNALNGAFESFVNDNAQSPEFISLFVDDQLRRGLKGHSEDDMERLLDKVVMLFRYLQDKDIFEKYYKQHLAKRLLGARSVSDDAERSMITKLKHECGYQFTSKLEGMFLDMKMSADTQDAFREKVLQPSGSSKIDGVELGVHVLTTGFWPTQLGPRCNLPPQIARCCEAFKDFYLKQHSGRKLTWQTNMGNADIKASFRARRHEINVSTHQMCILLLFNGCDAMSYAEIAADTQIPPAELKRALQSLACAKYKILNKEPKGRDVDDGDAFHYNADFSAKQLRFKVGTVSATKETEVEKAETRQKVDEDRKPQIEVRLLPTICEGPRSSSHSPPPHPSAGGDRAHHEVSEGDGPQRADRRGDDAAAGALPRQPERDQEAARVAHRARVPRARQGELAQVQVPGVIEPHRRVSVSASQCDSC